MQQEQPITEAETVDQEFVTTRNEMREAIIQAVTVVPQDLGLVSDVPGTDAVEEVALPTEEAGEAEQQKAEEEASKPRPTKKYKPIKLNRAQRRFRAHKERVKRRKDIRKQAPVWPVPVETRSARCLFCNLPYIGPTSARCQHPAMPTKARLERFKALLLALQADEADADKVSPEEVAA